MSRQGNDANVIDLCSSSDDSSDDEDKGGLRQCSSKPARKRCRLDCVQHETKSQADSVREVHVAKANTLNANLSTGAASSADKETAEVLVLLSNDDGNDKCAVTSGINELLQDLAGISSCVGRRQADKTTTSCSCRHPFNKQTADKCPQLHHIQQRDKWSCGFRNLQMIQMALVPMLPAQHSYHQYSSGSSLAGSKLVEIPSLRRLQQNMETAWQQDFDPEGAEHYRHRIVGKKVWIGAVEVSNLMTFMGLDSTLVQFIKCPASRRLLVPFCRAYFSCSYTDLEASSSAACCTTVSQVSSLSIAQNSLKAASKGATFAPCQCARLPLYLQWRGHSVTIVGVVNSSSSSELLVLDPMRNGKAVTSALKRQDMKGLGFDSRKLEREDCQIVVVSTRSLSSDERGRFGKQMQSLTAAELDVMRVVKREKRRF